MYSGYNGLHSGMNDGRDSVKRKGYGEGDNEGKSLTGKEAQEQKQIEEPTVAQGKAQTLVLTEECTVGRTV